MSKLAKETYFVLIADDSAEDRFLMTAALRHARRLKTIAEVSDGHEVISYLDGSAGFHDRRKYPLPDLLLLDLKMPLTDGFEVLEWLRTRSFLNLTIVVLTDSMRAEHIKRAMDLGADFFQIKPTAHADRITMVQALEEHLTRPEPALAVRSFKRIKRRMPRNSLWPSDSFY
jgi:CheY-like chemotaxis protein